MEDEHSHLIRNILLGVGGAITAKELYPHRKEIQDKLKQGYQSSKPSIIKAANKAKDMYHVVTPEVKKVGAGLVQGYKMHDNDPDKSTVSNIKDKVVQAVSNANHLYHNKPTKNEFKDVTGDNFEKLPKKENHVPVTPGGKQIYSYSNESELKRQAVINRLKNKVKK